jgi:hypothetical protein
MNLSSFSRGEKLAGVGGLVLLVSLFLPWYASEDAWTVFTWTDILLAVTAAAAIAMVLLSADTADDLPGRLSLPAAVVVLGVISAIWILVRMGNPPGPSVEKGVSRDLGIYIGFFACVPIIYGAYLGMRGDTLPDPDDDDR